MNIGLRLAKLEVLVAGVADSSDEQYDKARQRLRGRRPDLSDVDIDLLGALQVWTLEDLVVATHAEADVPDRSR